MVADIPTLKEFYERVLNVTCCSTCSSTESQRSKQIQEMLLTPEAYAEYIGLNHIKQVGHSFQSLLVDCKLIVIEGRIFKHIPCFPGVKVFDRYDVKYYNCYTLQLPKPSLPGHLYLGLALVLHLDNFYQGRVKYLDKTNILKRMAGIEMNFYPPNTPLVLDFKSVFFYHQDLWPILGWALKVGNTSPFRMELVIRMHYFTTQQIIAMLTVFSPMSLIQYIPRNMHTVFALLCFVVVIHWLIFPYPSGLLHWHCGNVTIAPVPAKQSWRIWMNTSCEFIMNDCITTTKQSTTKPCAYFLGYTVPVAAWTRTHT